MNNDLISRSELKKAIEKGEGFSWDSLGKDDLCVRKKYIDNVPTVDCIEFNRAKELIKQAYQKGKYIRPQGECKCVTCKCRESCSTFCETYNYKLPEKCECYKGGAE